VKILAAYVVVVQYLLTVHMTYFTLRSWLQTLFVACTVRFFLSFDVILSVTDTESAVCVCVCV